MNRRLLVLALAGLLGCSVAWSQTGWFVPTDPFAAELEVDHDTSTEFITPHTDWGSPWAHGGARVLFFVNGRGTAAREIMELTQRFDIEAQMVFWGRLIDTSNDDWHGGEAGQRRIDRLLGEEWDAFVFLNIRPEGLSSEQQYKMLQAVADGAGLVHCRLQFRCRNPSPRGMMNCLTACRQTACALPKVRSPEWHRLC